MSRCPFSRPSAVCAASIVENSANDVGFACATPNTDLDNAGLSGVGVCKDAAAERLLSTDTDAGNLQKHETM